MVTKDKKANKVMEDQIEQVFKRKELLKQPNTEIGKHLNIHPVTVAKRIKTPTYERLREQAYEALNDQFGGNIMDHWAKLVFDLSKANKKSVIDYNARKEALRLIQDTLGLDAPKVEKVEHSVNMLDLDDLEDLVDEAIEDFDAGFPDRTALPQLKKTVEQDQNEDDRPVVEEEALGHD